MKKTLLIIAAAAVVETAQAYDYPYLTLQKSDGTEQSVAVEQLKLTFSDGQLVLSNSDGTTTISLSDLSKMYFSTSATAGISTQITEATDDSPVEVYTLSGMSIGSFESVAEAKKQLKAGIYVMKSKTRTLKITVK